MAIMQTADGPVNHDGFTVNGVGQDQGWFLVDTISTLIGRRGDFGQRWM